MKKKIGKIILGGVGGHCAPRNIEIGRKKKFGGVRKVTPTWLESHMGAIPWVQLHVVQFHLDAIPCWFNPVDAIPYGCNTSNWKSLYNYDKFEKD